VQINFIVIDIIRLSPVSSWSFLFISRLVSLMILVFYLVFKIQLIVNLILKRGITSFPRRFYFQIILIVENWEKII